ncbi:MAG: tetratricopeptide repeat protein [Candidatus Melainabacteria bacterium]|nr:tetratricopeptide repeat protein [Candidatus Melainabacteria bacterium]
MQREKMRSNQGSLQSIFAGFALSLALSAAPASAQGLSEYGGLMGMPKPMPTGHAGALQNLYGAGSLDKITAPGAGAGAGSALPLVGDSRVIAKNVADKANAFFNEAQKKEKAGKLAEAEALYRSSAAWRERVWGTKDPAVFVIYGRLGKLCTKQNKLPEAEAAYRRQVTCAVRLYGAGAYEMCPILINLAQTCMAENKLPDAISTYRQVYQLKKRKVGDTNAETLAVMLKLAYALKQNGNAVEAEALCKEGARLAQLTQENDLLVQAFNEVINPPAAPAADATAPAGASTAPANTAPATTAPATTAPSTTAPSTTAPATGPAGSTPGAGTSAVAPSTTAPNVAPGSAQEKNAEKSADAKKDK